MEPVLKNVGESLQSQRKDWKIQKKFYLAEGEVPVIDQGAEFIAGYINEPKKAYKGPLPVIVFGDHTCCLKYVSHRFAVGADGTQLIRPSAGFDVRFFYYALRSLDMQHFGYQRHFKLLKTKEIPWFPLPIQKKIAGILSSYDDLIENNLRRIKILEEMAQSLYREWFVKFRFPGHEYTRFVDSPIGPIPVEWEVRKVGELLAKVARGPKIPKKDYEPEGTIPVIDQGKEFIGGFTEDRASRIDDLPIILFGDHTRILKYIDFPFACGADGTQLLKSNARRMPMALFYYALAATDLSNFAYARHFKFLKEEYVCVPTEEVAVRFDNIAVRQRDQIRTLTQQNAVLRRTHNLLLPKLISGELDVSDLDIAVPEEIA